MSDKLPGGTDAAGWDHTLRITALKCGCLVRLRVLPFLGNKISRKWLCDRVIFGIRTRGWRCRVGEQGRVRKALPGERSPPITSHSWLAISLPKVLCFPSFCQEAVSLPLFNREPYDSLHRSPALWLGHAVEVKFFLDSLPILKSYLLLANESTYVGPVSPTLLKAV